MNTHKTGSGTMRGRVSLIATLFLLAVLVLPASALQLNGQDVSAEIIGATVEYPVILDEAPAGLSSYNITVTLTDPAVGEITSAEFPAWATENEMSTIPADSVTIQGLDFNEQVQEGATNISLATLTIRADAAGTTPVIITINGMYDEIGGIMSPAIQDGSFTVTEPLVSPVADFIADPASGVEPLTVAFTDLSTGDITGYAWDFENDGVVDSTEQNPGHIYPLAGTYTVNLTVTGPGGSDDEVKVDYITVTAAPVPAPVADFIADPASGVEPLTVAFTDLSTGDITGYAWDFENDGVVDSTEQNPSYIYPLAGTYTVNLTVTGPGGSDDEVKVEYISVTAAPVPAPVADFIADPASGVEPLTVAFTDLSTGDITGYAWDFENDGVVDSTEQNPGHIYPLAGTYTVNLTVTGPGGSDDEVKVDYITVTAAPVPAPVADFIADPASGVEPLTVAFADLSTGDITGYAWDFENDGVVDSTEQNPSYIYPLAGTYTVNLTVTGPGGSDDEVKVEYISVTAAPVPAPVADFIADPASGVEPLTVAFTDLSTGDITGYAWDFENDGVVDSTEQNPGHTYPAAGMYTVNLTVTGPGGSDDEVEYITVTAAPAPAQVRAEIRIEPETLNLKSSGVFTVFITLPDEYSVTEISADSLVSEGANAKSGKVISGMENEYMAKFQRQDLENVIPGDAVTFTLSGTLNTDAGMVEFVGNEMIRVIE